MADVEGGAASVPAPKGAEKNDAKGGDDESLASKILTVIIIIFIIAIWLAIFALLIRYDVGGFGSTVLRPILKDVPVINRILPEVPNEQVAEENEYPYRNLNEAMERIETLEAELASIRSNNTDNSEYVAQLESEVARLRTFEENQLAFEAEKDSFDREVVFTANAPDTEEYRKYYEEIDPDNAAEIYRQIVEQMETSQKAIDQAEMFKSMKPANAAAIMNTMTGDLDLVAEILVNLDPKDAGAIIAEMDTSMAAKVTKKISTMQ